MEEADASGRRLRVGLAGAGLVGQAEHAYYLAEDAARFDLVAVADPSAGVRTAVGERFGVPHRCADVAELLDLGLDALVCAVPDPLHAEVAIAALDGGLHVLCEKPLALSLAECDAMIAARDRAGRVLQVAYMKRFDPAYERLLELLPERADDVRQVVATCNDPGQGPFVAHLGLTEPDDLPPDAGDELRARAAARLRDASGGEPPTWGGRGFGGYLSSLVHDVNLLHGLLGRLGHELPAQPAAAAVWDDGRGVQLDVPLPGGGRAALSHLRLPGVNDYTETLRVLCTDRILELEFPSPYLRHLPTRLVETRSTGTTGVEVCHHHVSYEESFRNELRAFHAAVVDGEPVRTTPEEARRDVELLLAAFRVALEAA